MPALASAVANHRPGDRSLGTTLLGLVLALNEVTASPEETVERALSALESGAVHLTGNFRGQRLTG